MDRLDQLAALEHKDHLAISATQLADMLLLDGLVVGIHLDVGTNVVHIQTTGGDGSQQQSVFTAPKVRSYHTDTLLGGEALMRTIVDPDGEKGDVLAQKLMEEAAKKISDAGYWMVPRPETCADWQKRSLAEQAADEA